MVNKRYIKRGGKVFGPYLYETYKENGVVKTQYLGIEKSKKSGRARRGIFILGVLLLLIFIMGFTGLLLTEKQNLFKTSVKTEEGLASVSFLDNLLNIFTTSSPLNVFVQVVTNTAPRFDDSTRPEEILVCEGDFVDEELIVIDDEKDRLELNFKDRLGIPFSFYPNPVPRGNKYNTVNFRSPLITWRDIKRTGRRVEDNNWAIYPEEIIVSDGAKIDSFNTNIIIIEVNNPPEFNIPVQTILPNDVLYTVGKENNFYYDVGKYLKRNGEETSISDLVFNLINKDDTESIFSISDEGVINITGDESFILSGDSYTYDLKVCVDDDGIKKPHPELLKECSALGLSGSPQTYCDEFSLTVTKENRAPIITSYYPNITNLSVKGDETLYFNLTAFDADLTSVDVYWYVDDEEKEYYEELDVKNVSEFKYVFGCDISGEHIIRAIVTDGLANSSIEWNLSVDFVDCPVPVEGGGGGGSSRLYCEEKWACEEWKNCEYLKPLVEYGWTSEETELTIKERCDVFGWTDEFCGFQQRFCTDYNYCKTETKKPGTIRECYYTENPNCEDGIKNCHDNECEILIDCGGPCDDCPTCSDGIKNQNEERVDCGGECRACLEFAWAPQVFKMMVSYSLIGLLILGLFLMFRQTISYVKNKKMLREIGIRNRIIKGIKRKKIFKGAGGNKNVKTRNVVLGLFFIFLIIGFLFFANFYITSFSQQGKIPSSIDIGFLANYGFMNNFLKSFGVFFVSGPVLSNDETIELTIFDDSDGGNIFRSGETIKFYAEYVYINNGDSVTDGFCRIRFEDYNGDFSEWEDMVYKEELGNFQIEKVFDYKEEYDFEVECSKEQGFDDTTNEFAKDSKEFVITNTRPDFNIEDVEMDGEEDLEYFYDFSLGVDEPDINDVLRFSIESINLEDKNNYPWIDLDSDIGVLTINAENDDEVGLFKVSVILLDSDDVGVTDDFYFNIAPVNDAPEFVGLEDKTFNALDVFDYSLIVEDEEDNTPFDLEINFLSCDTPARAEGDCVLFEAERDYTFDEESGVIHINFIPTQEDVGTYSVEFKVSDTRDMAKESKTTSQIVNFVVDASFWKDDAKLDYPNLVEDSVFNLDLKSLIAPEFVDNIEFSFNDEDVEDFSGFSLTPEGIISFTPKDLDVGYHEVEIMANYGGLSSSRVFKFTIENVNDNMIIKSLMIDSLYGQVIVDGMGHKVIIDNSNVEVLEYSRITLELVIEDDDFLIPEWQSQSGSYNEEMDIDLTFIGGPNDELFEFNLKQIDENTGIYEAVFTPREGDFVNPEDGFVDYNVDMIVTDALRVSSDSLNFDLKIENREYDEPVITFPDEGVVFELEEGVSDFTDLVFRAKHTVGDELRWNFYIDEVLKDSILVPSDDRDFVWEFTPNFTDETYDELVDLKLEIINDVIPEFNDGKTWKLRIKHANAPVEFKGEIQDKSLPYNYEYLMNLREYFSDVDAEDSHYNQSVKFVVLSNETESNINLIGEDVNSWNFMISSKVDELYKEKLNITVYDLDEFGDVLTSNTSNYFVVEFRGPILTPDPQPQPSSSWGGGGGGGGTPISLKIISPGKISVYDEEKIIIPIQLLNTGKKSFNDLSLNVSVFKEGNITNKIRTFLDKDYFKTLKPNQQENLTLEVFFDEEGSGAYEILINAKSKYPNYKDSEKIYLNPINDSDTEELIIFTEEFIAERPECIEISEVLNEAKDYLDKGDYINAEIKTRQALTSCKEAISQASSPRIKIPYFIVSLYLVMGIIIALVIGLIYYFIKRRRFQKLVLKEPVLNKPILNTR